MNDYKGYRFYYWRKPIPDRRHDYEAVHYDYDGPGDSRSFTGSSAEDLKKQIDEFEIEGE